MTKENLFELLKSSILALINNPQKDAQLDKALTEEREKIRIETKALSPEDLHWLNKEYTEWAEKNIINKPIH